MTKATKRVISVLLLAVILTVSAVAAARSVSNGTLNGISISVGASAYSTEATSYALCNSATSVTTTVSAYTANHVYLGGRTKTGSNDAMASYSAGSTASYAIGTSSAVINGVTKTGPAATAYFN